MQKTNKVAYLSLVPGAMKLPCLMKKKKINQHLPTLQDLTVEDTCVKYCEKASDLADHVRFKFYIDPRKLLAQRFKGDESVQIVATILP